MRERKYRIGIVGCGKIFPAYMDGLARFDHLEPIRCADVIAERAYAGHADYGIPRFGGPYELFADEDVEIVLNLTPPETHAEVTADALEAGKHVSTETTLEDADRLIALSQSTGRQLGAAPDTFLGQWRVEEVAVNTPTHSTAVPRFASGALGTIIFSSDVWGNELPHVEVYGSRGTMSLPHPNWFDRDARFKRATSRDAPWEVVPAVAPAGGLRGEGIADTAAIESRCERPVWADLPVADLLSPAFA
jgi:predicted dehydrogenase